MPPCFPALPLLSDDDEEDIRKVADCTPKSSFAKRLASITPAQAIHTKIIESDDKDIEEFDISFLTPTKSQSCEVNVTCFNNPVLTSIENSTPSSTSSLKTYNNQREATERTKSNSAAENSFLDRHFAPHQLRSKQNKGYVKVDLDNFVIYERSNPRQFESLHTVLCNIKKSTLSYCFDGELIHESGDRLHLKAVRIRDGQIDNLGAFKDCPASSSCDGPFTISTSNSELHSCYYYLQTPNHYYEPIYHSFRWLATFTKHIIDFLIWVEANKRDATLKDLGCLFPQKLQEWHAGKPDFENWHRECDLTTDFRRHFTSPGYAVFIFDQARSISQGRDDPILDFQLWKDVGLLPLPKVQVGMQTIVLPQAYKCFVRAFPKWGPKGFDLLKTTIVDPRVAQDQACRRRTVGLVNKLKHVKPEHFETHESRSFSRASMLLERAEYAPRHPIVWLDHELLGKAVIVRKRQSFTPTYRYAYVREVHRNKLRVSWLALPSQTLCGGRLPDQGSQRSTAAMFYPVGNELFMTSECTCSFVPIKDIVAAYSISFGSSYARKGSDFFVYHLYHYNSQTMTLVSAEDDRICTEHCNEEEENTLCTGENDEVTRVPPVNVMSLFTGCGALDYGFKQGSGDIFRTVFAVDLDGPAMLSFRANHSSPDDCSFHQEDVNELFCELVAGHIPFPNVDILIAGPPCPGYSRLNMNKQRRESQQHCSMLAHTLSWVELLLPKMLLLENVVGMDCSDLAMPSAAGQAVCHLVSLGYQVKLDTVKASDVGGATSRCRLFLVATTPDIPLPATPPVDGNQDPLSVATATVTQDLQHVTNDVVLNPMRPDHVPYFRLDPFIQRIISRIPRKAARTTAMAALGTYALWTEEEQAWYKTLSKMQRQKGSHTLQRVHPGKPSPTIVTSMRPFCAKLGTVLHWLDDRVLSLQEVRRFQGVPDPYILIGSKHDQYRQIGNSVAWSVSTAWGKEFRKAWVVGLRNLGSADPDVEELAEDEGTKAEQALDLNNLTNLNGLRGSLPPLSKEKTVYEAKSAEEPLPNLRGAAALKRSRALDTNSASCVDGEGMPDLANLVTPMPSDRQIVRHTAENERLSIASQGSILQGEKETTVTIRKRRSPSEKSEETLLKRRRRTLRERFGLDRTLAIRAAVHADRDRGWSYDDDAIYIDDD